MRPYGVPAARFPGLTATGAKGKCSGCYKREDVAPAKRKAENAARAERRRAAAQLSKDARASLALERAEKRAEALQASEDLAQRIRAAAERDGRDTDARLAAHVPAFFQYLTARRRRGIPTEGLPFALWPANLRLPQEAPAN